MRIHPNAEIPKYHTPGSAGFDLAIVEDTVIPPGEAVLAHTGLIVAAPRGHMLLVAPRSSTFKRYGLKLANSIGIVDEDYCGDEDELRINLLNTTATTKTLTRGLRLAQGVFVPITRVDFCELDAMGESRGGWGSTGE